MNDLHLSLIGNGYWGSKIYQLLSNNKSVADIVVVDIKNRISRTLESILTDKLILTCLIATPEQTHYDLVKRCLEAGKHVFVEKPLCLTSSEAELLINLAIQQNVCLFVDYTFLYDPAVQKIKDLIKQNEIGKIQSIESYRYSPNIYKPQITVFDDLAPHDIYLIRELTNSMPRQSRISGRDSNSTEGNVEFPLKNGIKWTGNYSWIQSIGKRQLIINGSLGKLIWDKANHLDTITIILKDGSSQILYIEKSISPLAKSIATFFTLCETELSDERKKRYNYYLADVRVLESIRVSNTTFQSSNAT